MAPKRPAPPPPPAASSSEETDSGSSDEESEEEMTHAPPPAAKGKATPPPPPQKKMKPVDVEEEEESGDEEDDEEEEDGEAPTVAAIATQAPPPPPPPRVEPEEEEEEDEEENEEEGAPKGEPAAANGMAQDKKPAGAAQRIWSVEDEVRILEALAAYRQKHGKLPQPDALAAALAGKLDHNIRGPSDLQSKVGTLKRKYVTLAGKKGKLPSKEQDRKLFDLSRAVWGTDHEGQKRGLDELCRLYPYFAAEVEAQEALQPRLFNRELMKVNEKTARSINARIRKDKLHQINMEMRRQDLVKTVTKELKRLVP